MKIKELKHNHSLTDLLKVILFSIVMLLPFFSVLTRSLYVICNKNAYQSYSGTASGEYELVDSLVAGEDYTFNKPYSENFQFNGDIYVDITNFATSNTGLENFYLNNSDSINRLVFTITTNTGSKMELYNGTTYLDYWTIQPNMSLFIEFTATANATLTDNTNIRQYSVTNSTLDNAFEYSLNELENKDLFSWTKNTGTYTAINAMCTGLEMQMPVIPVILTYWFLISVIYLVLDIVIKTITYITHIIGSRA